MYPLTKYPAFTKLDQTPSAVSRLRSLLNGPTPQLIRIGVRNKGCAGLSYHLDYVEKPGKFDEVVAQDDVRVLIDSKALFSIIGSQMDWQENALRRVFCLIWQANPLQLVFSLVPNSFLRILISRMRAVAENRLMLNHSYAAMHSRCQLLHFIYLHVCIPTSCIK